MANRLVTEAELTGVANHIRQRTGGSAPLAWPGGFEGAVDSIPSPQLIDGRIESNGEHTAPSGAAWRSITAAVPNTYAAADEGKVVADDGQGNLELQAQGTLNASANGTYDTTKIHECVVTNCYEPFVTAADFQTIIKNGKGPLRFPVHSRIRVPYNGELMCVEIVSHSTDRDKAAPNDPTVSLMVLDGLAGKRFCARSKFFVCVSAALPNAQYNFKAQGGSTRSCTLRSTTPIGGYGIFEGGDTSKIATYDAGGNLIEQDDASLFVVGTALKNVAGLSLNGAENEGYYRASYGSGNYKESPLPDWLNASGLYAFSPKTIFDLPPDYDGTAGFLGLLDPAWAAILKRTDQVTAKNAVWEADGQTGGSYVTDDLIFLPSRTQLGLGQNNGVSEGAVWQAFDGTGTSRGAMDRIKSDSTHDTIVYWWTRSCVPTVTYQAQDGLQFPGLPSEYNACDAVPRVCPCFVI